MARIQNGVVVNLEFFDSYARETDTLRNVYDLMIEIGDTYADGKFFRNGVEMISHRESIYKMLRDYDSALTNIAAYVSAPVSLSEGESPTIDDRKEAILERVNDMLSALNIMEVTPSEQ